MRTERVANMLGLNIGIDLGTSTIIIFVEGKGIVLNEPCVAAIETDTGQMIAAGQDAIKMIGRTPDYLTVIHPVMDGVISDYTVTEQMLRYFLRKVCGNTLFKPKIMVCMPSSITSVEEKTIIDVLINAGARKACIMQAPIAAAIGAGIDITKPHGSFIVDIGGGTTDIAVITLDNIAVTSSIKVAGKEFDNAIIRYIRRKYDILIGDLTAENIKKKIGSARPREVEVAIAARGRNFITGMPESFEVTSTDVYEALQESIALITIEVQHVMEHTPPELIADVYSDGITLTGGGSLLYGFAQHLTQATGVTCRLAEDPTNCVAVGTGKSLKNIDKFIAGNYKFISKNEFEEE